MRLRCILTLMGHFGAQTGYPVLNVDVTNADGMKTDGRKDYLVLGTVEDQPALSKLNPSLPVMVDGSGLHIQDTQGFFAPLQHAWWKVRSSDHIQSGQLETAGGLPDALIEGIEWPSWVEPVGGDRGVARPYRGAELPVGVPEVLAVVGYFAVGECAARRAVCLLPDRQRRVQGRIAFVLDAGQHVVLGVSVADCVLDAVPVLPDGGVDSCDVAATGAGSAAGK